MKHFKMLLLLAVVLTAAAWFLGQQESNKFTDHSGQALLPDFAEQLGQLDTVQLQSGPETQLTLRRDGEQWLIQERDGYPADADKLSQELRKLAQAQILEAKTSNPELYHHLHLDPPSEPDAKSIRLLASQGETVTLDLILGKSDKRGQFVRHQAEAASWLIDQSLELPVKASAWLQAELLDLPRQDIAQIKVKPLDGPAFRLYRQDNDDDEGINELMLEPAPKADHSPNAANINRLGAALSRLRIKDVLSETPDGLNWAELEVHSQAGLILKLEVARAEDERYLRLTEILHSDSADENTMNQAQRLAALSRGRLFTVAQYPVDAMLMTHTMLQKAPPTE